MFTLNLFLFFLKWFKTKALVLFKRTNKKVKRRRWKYMKRRWMVALVLLLTVSGIAAGNLAASFVKPKKVSSPRERAIVMDTETIKKIESEALEVAKNNTTFMKFLKDGYTIKEIKPVIEAEVTKVPVKASNSNNITFYELTPRVLPLKLVKIILQKNNESVTALVRIDLKKVVGYEGQ